MQALEITKEAFARDQVFGIIFMDCSMPIMDGFESSILIRKFYRDQGAQQPIIVACTGHTEDEYIAQAWRSEIDEVVPKPIKSKILQLVLDETIYRFWDCLFARSGTLLFVRHSSLWNVVHEIENYYFDSNNSLVEESASHPTPPFACQKRVLQVLNSEHNSET